MPPDEFQDPEPSDRLGRMLVLSMVFHLALFGGLLWYNLKTPKSKLLAPTYTVDLVNLPLPAPGPKLEAKPDSPPPGVAAKPAAEPSDAGKRQPVEKKPVAPLKSAKPSPPPAVKAVPAPTPPKAAAPPPKPVAKPAPVAPKPEAPKPAPPPTPAPTVKPGLEPPKKPVPKAVAETKEPVAPVKKPVPETAQPAADPAKAKARERQLAQEINAAQRKAADASRQQQIQESVQGVEKALAAKSRDRAYKEAVGQAAARLSAGKVNAKVSSGTGGGGEGKGGGGSLGAAQAAAYGAQISVTVRRHWQPNCLQRSNMQHLKAVIIVRIQADGSIAASWFEKESGDRLFDQSAMTAVTRSSPLPPLPPGQEKLEIGITFTPEWKASSS